MWLILVPSIIILCAILYYFLVKLDSDFTLHLHSIFGHHENILAGKVVWITGASSGIGEHLAYELANCGCQLVLSGTSDVRLEKVKATCIEQGVLEKDILTIPFNIANYDAHQKALDDILERFGKLDILVNNAGRSQRANFLDIEIEVDKELFDINVFGPLNLTRVVLPHFLSRKQGQVVVTSSCVGKMGAGNSASYTGSKHALHGYFEALRTEMCSKNIKVNIVCPGPVFSNFLANAFTNKSGEKLGAGQMSSDKRMSTSRCSTLMAIAIAYNLDETWIAMQPCLTLYYLAQYTPTFFRKVLVEKLYNPERAARLREGRW